MTTSFSSAGWSCRFGLLLLCFAAPGVLFAQDLPDPTRFEVEIQGFEAHNDNPPPRGAIVLTDRSSITAGTIDPSKISRPSRSFRAGSAATS